MVGAGGTAGTTAGVPAGAGGTSSFGTYASATGGSLNPLHQRKRASERRDASGSGRRWRYYFSGPAGQAGISNVGGLGGGAAMSGTQNSGTFGTAGVFPGGRASGAGTGPNQKPNQRRCGRERPCCGEVVSMKRYARVQDGVVVELFETALDITVHACPASLPHSDLFRPICAVPVSSRSSWKAAFGCGSMAK